MSTFHDRYKQFYEMFVNPKYETLHDNIGDLMTKNEVVAEYFYMYNTDQDLVKITNAIKAFNEQNEKDAIKKDIFTCDNIDCAETNRPKMTPEQVYNLKGGRRKKTRRSRKTRKSRRRY